MKSAVYIPNFEKMSTNLPEIYSNLNPLKLLFLSEENWNQSRLELTSTTIGKLLVRLPSQLSNLSKDGEVPKSKTSLADSV